jgi:plastocyanin
LTIAVKWFHEREAEMLRTRAVVVALMLLPGVAQAAEYRVGQKDKAFSISTLTLKTGDSVVFENDDQITHNVYSAAKGSEFNLRAQAPGAKASVTFTSLGVVEVRCAFHPKMKLVVNVKR